MQICTSYPSSSAFISLRPLEGMEGRSGVALGWVRSEFVRVCVDLGVVGLRNVGVGPLNSQSST